jgi:hypothetical protein
VPGFMRNMEQSWDGVIMRGVQRMELFPFYVITCIYILSNIQLCTENTAKFSSTKILSSSVVLWFLECSD